MNFRDLRNIEQLSSFLRGLYYHIKQELCVTVLCQRGNKLGIWTTNSVDWCVVFTSQSWDLPNVHTWMICISVTISDVLREISDVWCFGSKSAVDWADVFTPVLYPFRMKIVRLIIFKFLSSISHSHVCWVIVPNWRCPLPSIGNNITRYTYNRFFHLMMILHSVSDWTWVIALCWVLVQNRRQKVFNRGALRLCRGAWHSEIWQKLHWFEVFHISIWGAWSFVWGAKPTIDPRGDGTVLVMEAFSLY